MVMDRILGHAYFRKLDKFPDQMHLTLFLASNGISEYLEMKMTYFLVSIFLNFWLWLNVVTTCGSGTNPVVQTIEAVGVSSLYTWF